MSKRPPLTDEKRFTGMIFGISDSVYSLSTHLAFSKGTEAWGKWRIKRMESSGTPKWLDNRMAKKREEILPWGLESLAPVASVGRGNGKIGGYLSGELFYL